MNDIDTKEEEEFKEGLWRLAHPVLPLARIMHFLYLTGPFDDPLEILEQFNEPAEIGEITYENPAEHLRPYSAELSILKALKGKATIPAALETEDGLGLDTFEAVQAWMQQQLLSRELETINSLLCAPCGCTLCCTGPTEAQSQLFFEIPLREQELDLFTLPRVTSGNSRAASPHDEPPLLTNSRPFYETAALYQWRQGWSLILPKNSRCPHLHPGKGYCEIYPRRPSVCRRPQIFPYLLEKKEDHRDGEQGKTTLPTYIQRDKLLAIWDCPYVRRFKETIARYAELCELQPVFMENKN